MCIQEQSNIDARLSMSTRTKGSPPARLFVTLRRHNISIVRKGFELQNVSTEVVGGMSTSEVENWARRLTNRRAADHVIGTSPKLGYTSSEG